MGAQDTVFSSTLLICTMHESLALLSLLLSSAMCFELAVPSSSLVEVGDIVYVSGLMNTLPGQDTAAQAKAVLRDMDAALRSVGLSRDSIVHVNAILADINDLVLWNTIYD